MRLGSRRGGESTAGSVNAAMLLESLPVPLALWNFDSSVVLLNEPLRQLLGFKGPSLPDALPLRWNECVAAADRESYAAHRRRLAEGQSSSVCQYRFFAKNRDSTIWLRESALLLDKPAGNRSVLSYYATVFEYETGSAQEVLAEFSHEVANSLQTIGAEVDVLQLSGALPGGTAERMGGELRQLGKLIGELGEYVTPQFSISPQAEDPALVIAEVIRASEAELAGQGIQIHLALQEKLPQLHLSLQFRSALKKLIDFSRVLLRDGGELTIAARMHGAPESRYLELKFINAAATSLTIRESEVFRPFLRVNQQQVGLSLAVARQILKHHRATISFRKQPDNCGVFSVLIDVPVRDSR